MAVVLIGGMSVGHAATVSGLYRSSAAGMCQSSYPATAGALVRARPLAVQNEGSNVAFVTCSYPTLGVDEEPNVFGLGIVFISDAPTNVPVTCTLVSGATRDANVVYQPKTQVIPAGSSDQFMMFLPSQLPTPAPTILLPNVSCGLPPGVGLQYLWYYYDRKVGQ